MKEVIREAVSDILKELGIPDADFSVEHPAEFAHGDYATNVAMVVAKRAGQNPRHLADQIVEKLQGQIEYVDKIDVAGPGFINFHLSRDFFTKEALRIVEQGDQWGKNNSWSGKKVIVEYTDPNPFKEFHVGHLFTNAVGESIARLFVMSGADTKRVNYQGDIGLHVAHAIYGMQDYGITPDKAIVAKELGKAYALGATKYKIDEKASERIREINKKLYSGANETRDDKEIKLLYEKGRIASLNYFETIYEILGTQFDEYFFESEAGPLGKKLVLDNPGVFPESEGARIYEGEKVRLHTRVFLNKEGLPTYEAKELALAKLKEDKLGVYDHSVISTAKEINEYFKVLLSAMAQVYPDLAQKTEHIGHGMVRLSTGKMSSRTGDVVAAIDFIEEIKEAVVVKMKQSGTTNVNEELARDIAVGAIKYATLKGSIYQDTVFNKEQALSFEGDSGPYLQYTHARINSVLEKARDAGVSSEIKVDNVPGDAYEVEKILYRFPEVVEEAFLDREPHQVATFLTELASSFNSLYANEKIADPSDPHAPYKCLLGRAVKQTLKNGLWLLAIKAPERM